MEEIQKENPKHILLTNNNRINLKDHADSKGIKVGQRFSKSVDMVIVSDKDPKEKEKKAKEKGITTLDDKSFLKL